MHLASGSSPNLIVFTLTCILFAVANEVSPVTRLLLFFSFPPFPAMSQMELWLLFAQIQLSQMKWPISIAITSSPFRQLSPEIIIAASSVRLPVLVCVNEALWFDKGAICVAAGEVRWRKETTGEVCNEAEKLGWSRGRMEWPRGRTLTASSIWRPSLHPHQ